MVGHWPERAVSAAIVDAEAGNILRSFPDISEAEAFLLRLIDAEPGRIKDLALVFFDKDGFALTTLPAETFAVH